MDTSSEIPPPSKTPPSRFPPAADRPSPAPPPEPISYEQFRAVDIRVGTIVDAEILASARRPAFRLIIDFGPAFGLRKSSAQITRHYQPDRLIGRQIAAVVNFPPKQIGRFISDVLVLGFPDAEGEVVLIGPDLPGPNGGRLF